MKALTSIALLLAGAACAPANPLEAWLVGDWAPLNSVGRDTCGDGDHVTYSADLTYRAFGERGQWSFDGSSLIETPTVIDERVQSGGPGDIGQAWTSTVEKLSEDRFRKNYARGTTAEFRRCRSPAPRRPDSLG